MLLYSFYVYFIDKFFFLCPCIVLPSERLSPG